MVGGFASLEGLQVPPLPLHGDLLSLGDRARLGRSDREGPADDLWLGSTCPGDTAGMRAMHTSWCALCTDFTCLQTPWWPLLVPTRTHSAPRPGGIQTNFGHAAAVTVRKGVFPQGQVFPTFTYMCSEHMAHASLVKFRAAETRCFQKCLIGAVGRHFRLNGEKD